VTAHFCHKRQQRHVPSALDGYRQSPLMLGAHTGLATRPNFTTLIDKTTQAVAILVVNIVHFIQTILAHSAPRREFLTAGGVSSIRTHSFYSSISRANGFNLKTG